MAEAFEELVDRVGGMRRVLTLMVGVVVAAALFGVSRWATAPEWVPAFVNQPMETVGQMTDKLQQAGIQFKLDRGGSDILVSANDVARARVTLAKDGLPSAGRPGLELFDQPSWEMTDFTQRINYRRALEGELERTIGKMQGIEGAQVHLALHEQSNFHDQDKPANASVVLKTRGPAPASDVVQGIAQLVASSVDGLTSDRVTVLDDAGRLLSLPPNDGSAAALTTTQMATQRSIETSLQSKAEELVSDMVGTGNARVRVAATLNFDKIERQSQLVDPEKQATSTEQRYEITPGAQGGAASSNVAMSYDNSHVTENFTGAVGDVKRLSVAVLVNDKMIPPPAGDSTKKPTYVARTPEELARIESLVRSAVGADSTRGDLVTVVGTHFDVLPVAAIEDAQKPDIWSRTEQFEKPGIALFAIVALLITVLMVLRTLRAMPTAKPAVALAAVGTPLAITSGAASGGYPTDAMNQHALAHGSGGMAQESFAGVPNDPRSQAIATVAARPDASARVVRAWLQEQPS